MLQKIFSHRPPLYDLFDKAELGALHPPWERIQLRWDQNVKSKLNKSKLMTEKNQLKTSEQVASCYPSSQSSFFKKKEEVMTKKIK